MHSSLSYFVKDNPMHGLVLQCSFFFKELNQVPGDGLAFTVRVSRQKQCLCTLQCTNDGLNVFFVTLNHLILHVEAVLGVDCAFFRHQIAHMTIRGQDFKVLA